MIHCLIPDRKKKKVSIHLDFSFCMCSVYFLRKNFINNCLMLNMMVGKKSEWCQTQSDHVFNCKYKYKTSSSWKYAYINAQKIYKMSQHFQSNIILDSIGPHFSILCIVLYFSFFHYWMSSRRWHAERKKSILRSVVFLDDKYHYDVTCLFEFNLFITY